MIVGVDEAGRGALAGPVSVAAVAWIEEGTGGLELKDSKLLSEKKREALAPKIKTHALAWAHQFISERLIDELNIHQATLLGMRRCLQNLLPRLPEGRKRIIVDGLFLPSVDWPPECEPLAKPHADRDFPAVSAASILAKTARDAYMRALEAHHKGYGFSVHKGYGTKAHLEALARLGAVPSHRKTFSPVNKWI